MHTLSAKSPNCQAENHAVGLPPLSVLAGCPASGQDGPLVQAPISCTPQIVNSPILAHGIDTYEASLALEIPADLLGKLEESKKAVQETSEDCDCVQFGETKLFTWAIQRTGVKLFPYVLKTGDVTLYISTRKADSPIPNARLRVGSLSCNNDLDGLLSTLKKWLSHYGVQWIKSDLSRLDLFVDIETHIKDTGIERQDHHITRATTCATHYTHRNLSGVQIGKSAIVLRVYDKLQEMKDHRSTEKEMFFLELWGKKPEAVTRIEFQLRRESITELIPGVTDWESVKPALPGVFAYLVQWFRHTEESLGALRENNNQHTAESSTFWKRVEQSIDAWREKFGKIREVVRNRKVKHFNLGPLVDQAAGCLMSVVAAMGHTHDDVFGMFATVQDLVTTKFFEIMDRDHFEKQYYARAALGSVTF